MPCDDQGLTVLYNGSGFSGGQSFLNQTNRTMKLANSYFYWGALGYPNAYCTWTFSDCEVEDNPCKDENEACEAVDFALGRRWNGSRYLWSAAIGHAYHPTNKGCNLDYGTNYPGYHPVDDPAQLNKGGYYYRTDLCLCGTPMSNPGGVSPDGYRNTNRFGLIGSYDNSWGIRFACPEHTASEALDYYKSVGYIETEGKKFPTVEYLIGGLDASLTAIYACNMHNIVEQSPASTISADKTKINTGLVNGIVHITEQCTENDFYLDFNTAVYENCRWKLKTVGEGAQPVSGLTGATTYSTGNVPIGFLDHSFEKSITYDTAENRDADTIGFGTDYAWYFVQKLCGQEDHAMTISTVSYRNSGTKSRIFTVKFNTVAMKNSYASNLVRLYLPEDIFNSRVGFNNPFSVLV